MPTIELSLEDLKSLVGDKLPTGKDELDHLLHNVKGELEDLDGDKLTIALGDSNRPELWSAEGLARELKGFLGAERGCKEYSAEKTDLRVFVNLKLEKLRPFIACAVVKNTKLNDTVIKQLMQFQDKIDATYGRNRRKTSIGLYNFDLLKFPLKYTLTKPHENAFTPLGFTEKLNPHEILRQHPKGQEYGGLLKGLEEYPILIDDAGKVLSMPPVINSNDLGSINENTKNILIEVTGTDYNSVNTVLTIFATALAERGGKIFSVQVDCPYRKQDITPHLETTTWKISVEQINNLLGTKFDNLDITKFLQKARYSISGDKDNLSVKVPCYRKDIMHSVDIIEDAAIGYGLNSFEAKSLILPTTGKLSEIEKLSNKLREICIGLGAQEVLNFTLTNKDNLFANMGTKVENVIEIENPVSLTYSCLRNKLLPSLMEFLSQNTTKEFPQIIFEVGDVTHIDTKQDEGSRTDRKLAFAISHSSVNFTEAKQNLDAIFRILGKNYDIREAEHDSFIVGRCAKIFVDNEDVGIIGEIYPAVLEKWGLEMPVVAFELRI
jgi:phenylalanyl-tRNA synthetase beta chain